eukprot:scaffold1230_cov166-Amphora_coffeaeformis.AAC.13
MSRFVDRVTFGASSRSHLSTVISQRSFVATKHGCLFVLVFCLFVGSVCVLDGTFPKTTANIFVIVLSMIPRGKQILLCALAWIFLLLAVNVMLARTGISTVTEAILTTATIMNSSATANLNNNINSTAEAEGQRTTISLSISSPPWVVFYHFFLPQAKGLDAAYHIIQEQLQQVGYSDAARILHQKGQKLAVYYTAVGRLMHNPTWIDDVCTNQTKYPLDCRRLAYFPRAYEEVTLARAHEFCVQNPNSRIIYLHSKGTFNKWHGWNNRKFVGTYCLCAFHLYCSRRTLNVRLFSLLDHYTSFCHIRHSMAATHDDGSHQGAMYKSTE